MWWRPVVFAIFFLITAGRSAEADDMSGYHLAPGKMALSPALDTFVQSGNSSMNNFSQIEYAPDRLLIRYQTDKYTLQELSSAKTSLHALTNASVMTDYSMLGIPGLELADWERKMFLTRFVSMSKAHM